ncbi:hypothetical protein [Falsiroseomonas selenitidurans]|uniref:Uncharacterized protein n=1 Tax=Falsiroseomonas selenitidurans TaxID=2716335 RepID=A0ABX1E3X5_9PROT|nr:hypothetical protein [Falsiroseomonas selenitidurans]NKC30217.1 hypothetical protein [Falsiroseomonas selenitidurans]
MGEPEPPSPAPTWLIQAWPRLLVSRRAALATGLPPEQALREAAAATLSPALPAACLTEAVAALAQVPDAQLGVRSD